MKKRMAFCILLAVALLVIPSCGKEDALVDCGQQVILRMDALADAEAYTEQFTPLSPNAASYTDAVRAQDFSTPNEIYRICLNDALALYGLQDAASLSETVRDKMTASAYASIASKLNSMIGTDAMIAASVCSDTMAFVCDTLTEHTAYLYVYENGHDVVVSFRVGEDGAVMATAQVLFDEEGAGGNAVGRFSGWATLEKVG
ncbi:MAG: hypothetical protein IJV98_01610 [Clostridia bacterium]|nr:hypothetical protein [Clostridia bacterium]